MHIVGYGASDVGQYRDHNEDAFLCFPEIGLWLMADGMGGHACGELASSLACEIILEQVLDHKPLVNAIEQAHQAIVEAGASKTFAKGMGTTVVALRIFDRNYELAWVGDSRAYLFNQNLTMLSHDHSYVQQLVDSGAISEEQAHSHPQRNLITQSVGSTINANIEVAHLSGACQVGDSFLLCTDGLSNELKDLEISEILTQSTTPYESVKQLIEQANKRGGTDNISAIVLYNKHSIDEKSYTQPVPWLYKLLNQTSLVSLPMLSSITILLIYQILVSFLAY